MRYIINLSYNGSAFCGWQIQSNAKTVQGQLQKALQTLTGREIEVIGAGRTDAGVNAVSYIAHFDFDGCLPAGPKQFCYKLNAILKPFIVINDIVPTSGQFHARFDAEERQYHYFIHFKRDPFCENFSWRCPCSLDVDKMNEAAGKLLGEHDFSCFEKTGGNNATSICTVYEAVWEEYVPGHVAIMGAPAGKGDYIYFRIRANRFLRNMVRAIVGTLIEIGRGRKDVKWMDEVLSSGDRSAAGQSVPGEALFLSNVKYPGK